MRKSNHPHKKAVHFIGIGGIGVSALARYFLSKGNIISGSDTSPSELTDQLKKEGIKIFIGHKPVNIAKGVDLIIHSAAIKKDNPEIKKAEQLGIPFKSYAEALGELAQQYKTIAIAGAHGKSTTTAMASLVFIKAGLDPTVIIGTKLKEFTPPAGGNNFRSGKSKLLIIEADEYKSSFLNYSPKIIVLTCLDRDHLDYFKNLGNIIKTFEKFIKKLAKTLAKTCVEINTFPFKNPLKNPCFFPLKNKKSKKITITIRIFGGARKMGLFFVFYKCICILVFDGVGNARPVCTSRINKHV